MAPIDTTARLTLAGIGCLLFLVVLFDAWFNAKSRFKYKKAPAELEKEPLTSQPYGVHYMSEVPTVPTALVAPDPSVHTFTQIPVSYPVPHN